jgi:malate dehydrogenase (oxaloacetate-decarboxylating)
MRDQKVAVFGAGTAGIGIADQIRDAMIADGASPEQAAAQIWPIDKPGLLFDDMDELRDFQLPYAKNRSELGVPAGQRVGLVEAIKMASPTMLLGCSTVYGAFSREVIEAMMASTERPLIFPISNPTSRMEAMPADVLAWSNGKALVATGSPVAPVQYDGTTYTIGQANNALVFPGLGLGTIVTRARTVSDGMLLAAADAVAGLVEASESGAAILPSIERVRDVSVCVAVAVAQVAVAEGLAVADLVDIAGEVRRAMWEPVYRDVRPGDPAPTRMRPQKARATEVERP